MKRLVRAIKNLTRSDFAARGDALRRESRKEMATMAAKGKAWSVMRKNLRDLGIGMDEDIKPKMTFGKGRLS